MLYLVSSTGLFRSTDAAATWRRIGEDLGITQVTDLTLDPARPEVIYALTNAGLVMSDDAGTTWAPVSSQPPAELELTCLTVGLDRSRSLYVGTRGDAVWQLDYGPRSSRARSRTISSR